MITHTYTCIRRRMHVICATVYDGLVCCVRVASISNAPQSGAFFHYWLFFFILFAALFANSNDTYSHSPPVLPGLGTTTTMWTANPHRTIITSHAMHTYWTTNNTPTPKMPIKSTHYTLRSSPANTRQYAHKHLDCIQCCCIGEIQWKITWCGGN